MSGTLVWICGWFYRRLPLNKRRDFGLDGPNAASFRPLSAGPWFAWQFLPWLRTRPCFSFFDVWPGDVAAEGLPAHSQNVLWLASGVNLAGLLLFGLRYWPIILLDAFPAHWIAGEPLLDLSRAGLVRECDGIAAGGLDDPASA